jgi:hypothetical protein
VASFVYTHAKALLLTAGLNFSTQDIRVMLVMTNTTADTEQDVDTISAFTTLDEYDGANYARQALTGEAVAEDEANNRGEFDANDATFTALGAGTRQAQAAVVFRHMTDDTDSIPIAYIDTGGFPFSGNGGNIVLQWHAEGIVQTT